MKITLDKYTHFFVGLSVAAVIGKPAGVIGSAIAVLLVAVGRESYNKYFQKKAFEWWDVIATCAGGASWIAYVLVYDLIF